MGRPVVAICGGVGAARLLRGLVQVVDPSQVIAIANVGDDFEVHGLSVSPDLDTITYTVCGQVNTETGWGLRGETWAAMGALARFTGTRPPGSLAGGTWFGLGDRDLATHLYRTGRRHEGAALSTITAEVASAFGLPFRLVPVTDDRLRTVLTVDDEDLDFQSWFVGRRHQGLVTHVRFDGAALARPAPGVLDAITHAERIVVCPSNPIVSIDPVLAVPGVRNALTRRREDVVAVSPIIAGSAVKGPAATLLADLGHEVSAVGVAHLYADFAGQLVIDDADVFLSRAVEAAGLRCTVAPTMMLSDDDSRALARLVLS